jgi:hypothetical protein
MNATTAAIDLAKNVFQVALADETSRVLEQHRLTRSQFERFFDNRSPTSLSSETLLEFVELMQLSDQPGVEHDLAVLAARAPLASFLTPAREHERVDGYILDLNPRSLLSCTALSLNSNV